MRSTAAQPPTSTPRARRAEVPVHLHRAPDSEVEDDCRLALPGQYLTFSLNGGDYGAAITRVQEILEYEDLTCVPGAPAWIRGVRNLRGRVVPVVDLAVKFGWPATSITRRTCVVIAEVRFEGSVSIMGILADTVSQVVEIDSAAIQPPPKLGGELRVDYLQGVARNGQSFVLLLDIDRLLLGDEILTAVAVAAGAEGDAEVSPRSPGEAASG